MLAKMGRRSERYNQALAFMVTLFEAVLTLTFIRLIYRLIMKLIRLITGKKAKVSAS